MNLRRRTMAASIAFIALALLGTSSYSVAKDDSVSAGICLADKRFAMLDQELSLTGNLADRAERITAEVMGSPEITSIEERQALTSDDSARSMVQRTLEVPASPGIPGARAVAFDEVGNPYVVMSPNSPVADIDRLPYSGAVDVTVLTSCITDKEIVDLRGAIQKESDRPALLGYNAFDDVLILITDESLDKVQKALAVTTSRIELIDEAVGQFARGADAAPHFAGSIISNNQAGGFCSSGFRVWNAAFGNLALSAGHCGNLNQTMNSGTNFYGTIVADSTSLDLLMMNGSTYAGRTYSANDDTTNQRINGASSPSLNVSYCNNGGYSRETCSNPLFVLGDYIAGPGLSWTNVTVHRRECSWGVVLGQPGDSGGPVNRELSDGRQQAVGVVVGGIPSDGLMSSCSQNMYLIYHPWGVVSSHWNLSIVNG